MFTALALIERTEPALSALLERFFPGPGQAPFPDEAGNVCVDEGQGHSAHAGYGGAVAGLSRLVATFSRAAAEQAALAGSSAHGPRPGLFGALALMRHPLDRRRQGMLMAKMLPSPPALHRHDDAVASCIWLRLWTLHAWVLELRLTMALSASTAPPCLNELDQCLSALLRPGTLWLGIRLRGNAAASRFIAASPPETLPVRNLAWPNRLGARLPSGRSLMEAVLRLGAGISIDADSASLNLGRRFAEIPAPPSGPLSGLRSGTGASVPRVWCDSDAGFNHLSRHPSSG